MKKRFTLVTQNVKLTPLKRVFDVKTSKQSVSDLSFKNNRHPPHHSNFTIRFYRNFTMKSKVFRVNELVVQLAVPNLENLLLPSK